MAGAGGRLTSHKVRGFRIPINWGPQPSDRDECLKSLPENTVNGRNPTNQLRLVAYPIIRVLYVPVVQDFSHQQYLILFSIP